MDEVSAGSSRAEPSEEQLKLFYPFYLDIDMTMAFAAALTGGVALELEDREREQAQSQAARKLSGGIRLFDVLNLGATRERSRSESSDVESRIVRRHTEASIFITLYDELRRSGRVESNPSPDVTPGQIVAMDTGPAMAPLRRIIDQVLRLLELNFPGLSPEEVAQPEVHPVKGGKQRSTIPAKVGGTSVRDSIPKELTQLRALFRSVLGDLDHSGMTDVVVRNEGGTSIVLTLDSRFVSEQALELLHTSQFTVIGKVTQVWKTDSEFVDLYRRSVLSLVPALGQSMGWFVLGLVGMMAAGINPTDVQKSVATALGLEMPEPDGSLPYEPRLGNDVQAAIPGLQGPAIQILPLAVCA
jgi:hypothetical protein